MSISVVLPLYNHAASLPLSIRSILGQTRPPDELVIVNDGSTDGGGDLADRIAKKHPHVRVIHHDANEGVVAALNAGIQSVTSEYVLCSAADDALLPTLLETACSELNEHTQAALFCSEVALVNDEHKVIGFRPSTLPTFKRRFIPPCEGRKLIQKSDNWHVGQSNVFRHAQLIGMGGFNADLGSMCDGLAARYLALRDGFVFSPEPLAVWHISDDSISHTRALDDSQYDSTVAIAGKWIAERSDVFPEGYAQLFARRYRLASARVRLRSQGNGPILRAMKLAPYLFSNKTVSLKLITQTALRQKWLASRVRGIEEKLLEYAHDADIFEAE